MYRKIVSSLSAVILGLVLCSAVFAAKVNINTADADTLADGINGVGPKIAEKIVKWRDENGSFDTVEQLTEVSGIGEKTLEKNRENLTVEGSSE